MAGEHKEQVAVLLREAEHVTAPATPVSLRYEERQRMVPDIRRGILMEALIHTGLHLAERVDALIDAIEHRR